MVDDSLVALLRCPETGQAVRVAPDRLLRDLRAQLGAGTLHDTKGNAVESPVQAALLRADGRRLFPIRDGIPVMLRDEAIDISA